MRIFDWGNPKRCFSTVAFDPTGRLLAAGGGQKATMVWDVATGAERARLRPVARFLRFHPHTGRLVVATKAAVHAADVDTGATKAVVDGWYPELPAFAPDADWCVFHHRRFGADRDVLTAYSRFGEPGQAVLWDVSVREIENDGGCTVALACVPNREQFISAECRPGRTYEQSRRITIRSRADGRVIRSWTGDIFGYSDQLFASPLLDSVIIQNGKMLRVRPLSDLGATPRVIRNDTKQHFTDVAFHPSGRYLAATSNDETVKLYDTRNWELARTFTWKIGKMRSIAFSPDGALAAAGSDTGKVVVWDVDM